MCSKQCRKNNAGYIKSTLCSHNSCFICCDTKYIQIWNSGNTLYIQYFECSLASADNMLKNDVPDRGVSSGAEAVWSAYLTTRQCDLNTARGKLSALSSFLGSFATWTDAQALKQKQWDNVIGSVRCILTNTIDLGVMALFGAAFLLSQKGHSIVGLVKKKRRQKRNTPAGLKVKYCCV